MGNPCGVLCSVTRAEMGLGRFLSPRRFCLSLPALHRCAWNAKEDHAHPHPLPRSPSSSRIPLVQPLLFLQHFPEGWCHLRAEGGQGGVKNNINKLSRNGGGQRAGLRLGAGGREGGSQSLLTFSHQSGEFCKRKRQRVSQRWAVRTDRPRPARWAPCAGLSRVSHPLPKSRRDGMTSVGMKEGREEGGKR